MKLAIVLEATLGGIRKHVVELIRNLPGDYELTFIYSCRRADAQFENDLELLNTTSVECIPLPMTNVLHHPANISCALRLARIFTSRKIEVIHLHGAVAGTLGRLAAIFCGNIRKIVYSPHGGVLHKSNRSLIGRIYVKIEKMLVTEKLAFIAVSSDEKEKIHKVLKISLERIYLVPNGIDVNNTVKKKYDAKEILRQKQRMHLAKDDFVILYPALFLQAKGHMDFFSAIINKTPPLNCRVKILLAGDGPLRSSVEALLGNTPIEKQVRFLGFVRNIDLYFQLADAVILPSVNEAFGYVLLEAMAFGKMIFATKVGGIKDIVENGKNGLLYDWDHLSEMVRDINSYSDRRSELKPFEEKGKSILNNRFDLGRTVEEIKRVYFA